MNDFVGAEGIAMGDIVLYSYLGHKDSSPEPEQSEEAMKWRFGRLHVVAIESRELAREDDFLELFLPSFRVKFLFL